MLLQPPPPPQTSWILYTTQAAVSQSGTRSSCGRTRRARAKQEGGSEMGRQRSGWPCLYVACRAAARALARGRGGEASCGRRWTVRRCGPAAAAVAVLAADTRQVAERHSLHGLTVSGYPTTGAWHTARAVHVLLAVDI